MFVSHYIRVSTGKAHLQFSIHKQEAETHGEEDEEEKGSIERKEGMAVMEKLRMFVAQEPVVTASCLIAGFGLFLPAVVRPILDSFDSAKQVPPTPLSDVVAGMTGKK